MTSPHVAAVRAFNRFYTRRIGVLGEKHLDSPFSLTEVRILYELAHRKSPIAAEIARDLSLDRGYLSRILRSFQRRGLVSRKRAPEDGRQSRLTLTAKGRQAFAPLERATNREIAEMVEAVPPADRERLTGAMQTIERLLGPPREVKVTVRSHRPGDMGWVIHRHGFLYAREEKYDERFEALVAEIAAKFIQNFDPARERCWIDERDGEFAGCIFLVKRSETVAQLRLLLVEPSARGLGIGRRLVGECVAFAREAGYRRITLWTQSTLHAAIHLYQEAGFQLTGDHPHAEFGIPLVSQTWDLEL